jgi:hypothetical protein
MILFVVLLSTSHGEPDQGFKSWHGIYDIAEENIPKFIIVHASGYDNMLIHPSVSRNIFQHRLALVDRNLKNVPINSARLDNMFRAVGFLADWIINNWEAIAHIVFFCL